MTLHKSYYTWSKLYMYSATLMQQEHLGVEPAVWGTSSQGLPCRLALALRATEGLRQKHRIPARGGGCGRWRIQTETGEVLTLPKGCLWDVQGVVEAGSLGHTRGVC